MIIKALDRKLLRDLWHMRGQAMAISLVIAAGISVFVMMVNTLVSLELTQQTYYERFRFAEVFAQVTRAPQAIATRIEAIPGVATVHPRVVKHVTLDVSGMAEPALAQMVSIPGRPKDGLNQLYLRAGRYIESDRSREILVSEGFANAHKLRPGDVLTAVLNGRKQDLRIVGVALSPEFIYQLPPGEVMPDDRRFAVIWMGHRALQSAFNMDGAFNDVSLTLLPGASEPEVIERINALLKTYGGVGAYARKDQASHQFISSEIEGLRGMGFMVPLIFLAVAAFLLNVVMVRVIDTQREQIAALKAFGYSNLAVGMHYGKFVMVIVAAGTVVGVASGAYLGKGLTAIYTAFYHFPVFIFKLDTRVLVGAIGIALFAALFATLTAVRRAVQLPPAEAMRPQPPASFKPTVVERMGLQRMFSPAARMVLRHLERNWGKSMITCVGIGMAAAVLVVGSFTMDSMTYVMDSQYEIAQRQDVTISLVERDEASVLHDIAHLPGVLEMEGYRVVPARLRFGHNSRRVRITGLDPDARLFRLIDMYRNKVPLPPGGVVMSKKLAEVLNVEPGDTITVEIMEGRRPEREIKVAALVDDFTGVSAYMTRESLNQMMHEGDVISGAYLSVEDHRVDALYTALKNTPRIAGVALKGAARESFENTVSDNMMQMRGAIIFFACIIAFGVVYNAVRISLSERGRELATLRVIGFTRGEVSSILLGELALLTAVGIPVGLFMGYGMAWAVVNTAFNTELFRIPLVIYPQTFAYAAVVVATAALVSGLIVRRRIDQFDLVAVLKSRE